MTLLKKILKSMAVAVIFASFLGIHFTHATIGAALSKPNSVFISGNHAYVTSELSNALEIIDISNPSKPTHKGSIVNGAGGATLFAPSSVAVSGNYAYVTSPLANAIEIVDVSDPANPLHKNTLFHGDGGGAQLSRPQSITISGNYAYVVVRGNQVIEILDISDPINPVHVISKFFGFLVTPTAVFISGNYLYVTILNIGQAGGNLQILDIFNPTHPIFVGGVENGTGGTLIDNPASVFVSGDYAYITSIQGHSLEIVNISDPTLPMHTGKILDGEDGTELLSPRSVVVSGNYAYVTAYVGNALEIINVSDPANPTHAGKFFYTGEVSYPISAVVSGNYAYVALNLENALDVIDISNPANPVLTSKIKDGELVGVPPPPVGCLADCFSNVLFLPGIKGSVLENDSDTLWPPTFFSNDISQLELNTDGESVNDIHTNGILDTFYSRPIYSPFSDFMDSISGNDKLINQWLPLAYDWRFSPEKILADGIKTETETLNIINEIEQLAAESKTSKITIVAHSMGGLLGKVIIKKLEEEGKDDLVDSFVMIGTPQLGTPQAISSMLHGDNEGILTGFIVNPIDIRKIAQNMPSAYNLLPSARYFTAVLDPVITFNESATFTEAWRDFWSETINTYAEFAEFMTGTGVIRTKPVEQNLQDPEVLQADFMANANNFHNEYDNYTFPEHIRVVEVVGWGSPTVKSVEYKMYHGYPNYETKFTVEGDRTVVYPSAVSSAVDETYFFNLDLYRDPDNKVAQHRDLLNTGSVQDVLTSIIRQENITEIDFISDTKPQVISLDDQLIVSTHSPVILGVSDKFGNFTGIDPDQDLSADVLEVKEEIPGSAFIYTSESQHTFLPKEDIYNFVYNGTGNGPTTIVIENFIDDVATLVALYMDIPTTAKTVATFTVQGATPENTEILLDLDGDNDVDINFKPRPDGTVAPYPFNGFLQPINDTTYQADQKPSVFKAGSTVPVKFQLKKVDGTIIQTNIPPIFLTPKIISSMSATIDEPVYTLPATIGNTFKWDPIGQQYIYNWSTKGFQPGKWYKISAQLDDGGTYNTVIGLR